MENEGRARLDALEVRVAALERGPALAPTPESAFWITEGLVQRGFDGIAFSGAVGVPALGTIRWQYGLPTATLLGQAWDEAASPLAALGNPVRLRLLRAVLEGRGRTAELAELPDVGSTGSLYHHLRELVVAGWLTVAGKAAHRIPGERIVPLLVILAASDALKTAEVAP